MSRTYRKFSKNIRTRPTPRQQEGHHFLRNSSKFPCSNYTYMYDEWYIAQLRAGLTTSNKGVKREPNDWRDHYKPKARKWIKRRLHKLKRQRIKDKLYKDISL